MRNFLIPAVCVAAAVSIAGSPAVAADLPGKAPAPIVAPPPPLWNGFYVGFNLGGAWGDRHNRNVFGNDNATAFLIANGFIPTGFGGGGGRGSFTAGLQMGFNVQLAQFWVGGVELDINWLDFDRRSTATGGVLPAGALFVGSPALAFDATRNHDHSYIGTLRARLGYLVAPNWLFYGTGGLAFGDPGVGGTLVARNAVTGATVAIWSADNNDTRVGWTVGLGTEWLFARNWSAKFEWLYFDFNDRTARLNLISGPGILTGTSVSYRHDAAGNMLRVGVNYRF